MTAHAAVRIDDDLATGKTGVAHWSADDEAAGRVDVVLGVFVQQFGGEDSLDDVLQDVSAELLVRNILSMLAGDDDGIDADRLAVGVVLDRDLALAVGDGGKT